MNREEVLMETHKLIDDRSKKYEEYLELRTKLETKEYELELMTNRKMLEISTNLEKSNEQIRKAKLQIELNEQQSYHLLVLDINLLKNQKDATINALDGLEFKIKSNIAFLRENKE